MLTTEKQIMANAQTNNDKHKIGVMIAKSHKGFSSVEINCSEKTTETPERFIL